MKDILTVATAGLQPEQIINSSHPHFPRIDYLELQRLYNIDVINYTAYDQSYLGRIFRSIETQLRSDLYLTLLSLLSKRHYKLIFSMSERVGIPYAGLHRSLPKRKTFLTMFQSWSKRQENAITKLNLLPAMDGIAVHCKSMKNYLINLGASPEHVHVLPYSVDQHFFKPQDYIGQKPGQIMSLGEIRTRDYPSLFKAVADLPISLIAAASGSWYAREKNNKLRIPVPANVSILQYLPSIKLRHFYAESQFVVLPVKDVHFSAGATAVLEAGCMERAVIATRSRGLSDFIIDGVTGILIEPGNVFAMRDAIQELLANPEKARQLGKNARERILKEQNLDIYVECMAKFMQAYL